MRKIIVGNWKCNPSTLAEAKKLFTKIKKLKAVICPPFPFLYPLIKTKSLLEFGAQDIFWKKSGPYTGEVSPKMLKDLGVKYVIVGHSERRKYFNESDETINRKLKAALESGLIPILCVGENKGQSPEKTVGLQLDRGLKGVKNLKKVLIAYEPVWAIGTGRFCSPEKANKVREFIKQRFDTKILYGGSVKKEIAGQYIGVGFDGLLVGGASLQAEEFIKIVKNA